jgi:hypothetical protein
VSGFAVIILGLVGGLVLAAVLVGLLAPGNGERELRWQLTRSPELEAQNELDDLEQMLEAANVRRRRRGEAELTEEDLHARVADDLRKQQALARDARRGRSGGA